MSTVYIPVQGGLSLWDELSRGVASLAWSGGVMPPRTVSTHAFGCLVHPLTGAVALELPSGFFVPLNAAANPFPLLSVLARLKDGYEQPLISAEDTLDLIGRVAQYAGQVVPVVALVPPKAMESAKTQEQMTADGWFASALPNEMPAVHPVVPQSGSAKR